MRGGHEKKSQKTRNLKRSTFGRLQGSHRRRLAVNDFPDASGSCQSCRVQFTAPKLSVVTLHFKVANLSIQQQLLLLCKFKLSLTIIYLSEFLECGVTEQLMLRIKSPVQAYSFVRKQTTLEQQNCRVGYLDRKVILPPCCPFFAQCYVDFAWLEDCCRDSQAYTFQTA